MMMKKQVEILDASSENEPYADYNEASEWCFKIAETRDRTAVVSEILARLAYEHRYWWIIALKEELARQYSTLKNFEASEKVLKELTVLNSSSPMAFSALSSHYLYAVDQPQQALDVILSAERLSNTSGHFRRHVLSQKARIALALDDYKLLDDILNALPDIIIQKDQRDVRKEFDFFVRADKSRLHIETVKKFERYIGNI
jgi:hypothetical protein